MYANASLACDVVTSWYIALYSYISHMNIKTRKLHVYHIQGYRVYLMYGLGWTNTVLKKVHVNSACHLNGEYKAINHSKCHFVLITINFNILYEVFKFKRVVEWFM